MDGRIWKRCVRETNQMAEKLAGKICPTMWKIRKGGKVNEGRKGKDC